MITVLKLKECETCEGAGALIENTGALKGMIITCPNCAGNYQKFINQYGVDPNDGQPSFYVDMEKGILKKTTKKKDYIIIGGKEFKIR